MAFTPDEQSYIKRLLQHSPKATNQEIKQLVNQRREKEKTINTPKEQGKLGKTIGFFQNIGAGGIQAGGELAVGLPGQLSRLLPGDQSANPNSFYNKTQNLLNSTKQDMAEQGVETEGAGFGIGKGIMNIAGGSVGAGLIGKGIQAGAKTGAAVNIGSKIVSKSPTVAKYGTSLLEGLTGATTKGNLGQRILGGITTGAREGLGYDLASGNQPGAGVKTGAIVGGALPVAGAIVRGIGKAGKWVYKGAIRPNADEARSIIQSEAKPFVEAKLDKAGNVIKNATGIKPPVTRADTALKYGITGTEKSLGVKGVREADNIFKKTINPVLEKSKITHSIDDILGKAEAQIQKEGSALRKQELMDGLEALRDEFKSTGKTIFSSKDLQLEKSSLDKFTMSKIFKGKEVAQGYNQVKNTVANVMREQVRDDLAKLGVKNAKELYRDYSNLVALEEIGVKGITEGGLKGGFGTFWSTIYDKIATPIRTVGGKYVYKLGKGIEFIGPPGIKKFGEFLKQNGYKVIGDKLVKINSLNGVITKAAIGTNSFSDKKLKTNDDILKR